MSEYRDSTITLAFKESVLQTPAGRIAAGPPAVIQIRNDDPLPSVSLTTSSLAIDEGMTETVAIIAEGTLGQRGHAGTPSSVTGDALISLLQDGDQLAARAGGTYTVDLAGNASTVLTIRADGDETLLKTTRPRPPR